VLLAVKKKEGTMKRTITMKRDQSVEFVDEIPRKRTGGGEGKWAAHLMPLVENPNRWALVHTCETPEQANKLQSNLHARMVIIPEPNHTWEFAARGIEVYAVYRGRKRAVSDASVRRANRR